MFFQMLLTCQLMSVFVCVRAHAHRSRHSQPCRCLGDCHPVATPSEGVGAALHYPHCWPPEGQSRHSRCLFRWCSEPSSSWLPWLTSSSFLFARRSGTSPQYKSQPEQNNSSSQSAGKHHTHYGTPPQGTPAPICSATPRHSWAQTCLGTDTPVSGGAGGWGS